MLYPIFLDLAGRDALVVGGGAAALRKIRLLRRADARVIAVARRFDADWGSLLSDPSLIRHTRAFQPEDVRGAVLVIAATGLADVDAAVAEAARAAAIPVNVVDGPGLSTFVQPAIVDRDPILVAVCGGGASPVLSRMVRARIEAMLPATLGRLARFADSFRGAVKAVVTVGRARRRFWETVLTGPIAAAVLQGQEQRAREQMLAALNRRDAVGDGGLVQLVGAGPGDPDLLTLRAQRALQEADVVLYDRLVGPRILEHARRDADFIAVGKAAGDHPMSQAAINASMLRLARAGNRVVRLKGGDPFVFGRGGEERDFLRRNGIAVEVIPGVSAALGCAAAAGIPLTQRSLSSAVTLVTGHGQDGEPDVDWAALARSPQTIAIYMGAAAAGTVRRRLIDGGRPPQTPAAAIAKGTLPEQRIATGTLADLPALVAEAGAGPILIVVGETVRQADAWQEQDRVTARAAG